MPSSVAQQLVQTLQALFPSSTWGRALALLVLFNAQVSSRDGTRPHRRVKLKVFFHRASL